MNLEIHLLREMLAECQRHRPLSQYAPPKVRERLDLHIAALKELLALRQHEPSPS